MNRLEELLVILGEEASEISKLTSKCVRFGIDSEYQGKSNREMLEAEIGDLLGTVGLISKETSMNVDNIIGCADKKMIKVEKYMTNSVVPTNIPAIFLQFVD